MFREVANYWCETIRNDDDHKYFIICDKEKDLPYRFEVLDKITYAKYVSQNYPTLEKVEFHLDLYIAELTANRI